MDSAPCILRGWRVFLFGLPFNLKNPNCAVIASGCPARIVTLLLASSIVVAIAISRSDCLNHVLGCNYNIELATCTLYMYYSWESSIVLCRRQWHISLKLRRTRTLHRTLFAIKRVCMYIICRAVALFHIHSFIDFVSSTTSNNLVARRLRQCTKFLILRWIRDCSCESIEKIKLFV